MSKANTIEYTVDAERALEYAEAWAGRMTIAKYAREYVKASKRAAKRTYEVVDTTKFEDGATVLKTPIGQIGVRAYISHSAVRGKRVTLSFSSGSRVEAGRMKFISVDTPDYLVSRSEDGTLSFDRVSNTRYWRNIRQVDKDTSQFADDCIGAFMEDHPDVIREIVTPKFNAIVQEQIDELEAKIAELKAQLI